MTPKDVSCSAMRLQQSSLLNLSVLAHTALLQKSHWHQLLNSAKVPTSNEAQRRLVCTQSHVQEQVRDSNTPGKLETNRRQKQESGITNRAQGLNTVSPEERWIFIFWVTPDGGSQHEDSTHTFCHHRRAELFLRSVLLNQKGCRERRLN